MKIENFQKETSEFIYTRFKKTGTEIEKQALDNLLSEIQTYLNKLWSPDYEITNIRFHEDFYLMAGNEYRYGEILNFDHFGNEWILRRQYKEIFSSESNPILNNLSHSLQSGKNFA